MHYRRRRARTLWRVADDFVVTAERHERVERMPGRNDIGDPGVERNPVKRRVRLDEAPVLLLGQQAILEIKRDAQVIQPRREVPEESGSSGVWKISSAQIICIQVVPVLRRVLITMSPGRKRKPSHRPLSSSGD
jgi:hypothetical protein